MTAVEITPAMVLEVTPVKRSAAERIAEYAALRIGGKLLIDACREVGVSDQTARHYEKVLPALCEHAGVDMPRQGSSGPWWKRDPRQGGHVRWHVGRGIVSPDCELCRGGVR